MQKKYEFNNVDNDKLSDPNDNKGKNTTDIRKQQITEKDWKAEFDQRGPDPLILKGTAAGKLLNDLRGLKNYQLTFPHEANQKKDKIHEDLLEKARESSRQVIPLAFERPDILGGNAFIAYYSNTTGHFSRDSDKKILKGKDKIIEVNAVRLARIEEFLWKLKNPDKEEEN